MLIFIFFVLNILVFQPQLYHLLINNEIYKYKFHIKLKKK